MASWADLERSNPPLAAAGARLLYQGAEHASAFLATVGPGMVPRVHPVFPVLCDGALWLFIVAMSPKYRDLRRNGKFALHSFPAPEGGQEFHLRGSARERTDPGIKAIVSAATGHRQGTLDFEVLFECNLESALYTHWDGWGTEKAWPRYSRWVSESVNEAR